VGESYGGLNAPMLALEILKYDQSIKFKRVGIGKGWLDEKIRNDYSVRNTYYHGFIGQEVWDEFTKMFCKCTEVGEVCDYGPASDTVLWSLFFDKIKLYNIYDSVCLLMKYNESGNVYFKGNGVMFDGRPPYPPKIYLNKQEVRQALGLSDSVPLWRSISGDVNKNYGRQVMSMRLHIKKPMTKNIKFVLYYGDLDLLCDQRGFSKFVHDLGQPVLCANNS
jgi:carboxypeptidase C (cathepsin A)